MTARRPPSPPQTRNRRPSVPPHERTWCSTTEIHELGLWHPKTLRRAIEDGRLPADCWTRWNPSGNERGGQYRIHRPNFEAWLLTRHAA